MNVVDKKKSSFSLCNPFFSCDDPCEFLTVVTMLDCVEPLIEYGNNPTFFHLIPNRGWRFLDPSCYPSNRHFQVHAFCISSEHFIPIALWLSFSNVFWQLNHLSLYFIKNLRCFFIVFKMFKLTSLFYSPEKLSLSNLFSSLTKLSFSCLEERRFGWFHLHFKECRWKCWKEASRAC